MVFNENYYNSISEWWSSLSVQRWNAGEWRVKKLRQSAPFHLWPAESSESWNLSQTGLHSDVTPHLLETNIFVSDSEKNVLLFWFRTQTGRCVTLSYSYFFIFVSLHSQIIPDKSKLASFIKCPSRATSTVLLMQLFSAQNDFSLSLLFHSVSKVQTMVGSYLLLD